MRRFLQSVGAQLSLALLLVVAIALGVVYLTVVPSLRDRAINTRVNGAALAEITGQSGGRTEVVQDMEGLRAATARIAEELNSQYVMAYSSPRATDGKYHSIRVRVARPGYKVRARNGYVGTVKPGSQRP